MFVSKQCGPCPCSSPSLLLWQGRRKDGEWLTGRLGMDYWMHIGILFSCQEIYSTVRKSILPTRPFSLLCWDIIQISEHQHSSDGLMWQFSDPSLSDVTVCRCKLLIFAAWCQPVIIIIWCLFPRAAWRLELGCRWSSVSFGCYLE